MKEGIFFYDDSIINWIGVILFSFLIVLAVWFSLWVAYLKARPARRDNYYLKSEWTNVPYHLLTFVVVGSFCVYGLWWEATRIDSAEYKNNTIVLRGFFGDELARFHVSEITNISGEKRVHITAGYGSTYKIMLTVHDKEFITRPLLLEEKESLMENLDRIIPINKK